MLDLIIIGAGTAGLSASIYACRAGLAVRTLERNGMGGGQLADAVQVENYPGFAQISGFDLTQKMREHAEALGSVLETADVSRLIWKQNYWEVESTNGKQYEARAVIAAMGTQRRKLDVPGEKQYLGHGVSYCATCDGAFFRGKTVAVIGGGDTAVDDALYLSDLAQTVYLVHRRDALRANQRRQQLLHTKKNIIFLWNTVILAIHGTEVVTAITTDTQGVKRGVPVDGVFVAIGAQPHTACLPSELVYDSGGYVLAGEDGKTNLPGLFVAGDIRSKSTRQAVTAAADGANCVFSVEQYLREQRETLI